MSTGWRRLFVVVVIGWLVFVYVQVVLGLAGNSTTLNLVLREDHDPDFSYVDFDQEDEDLRLALGDQAVQEKRDKLNRNHPEDNRYSALNALLDEWAQKRKDSFHEMLDEFPLPSLTENDVESLSAEVGSPPHLIVAQEDTARRLMRLRDLRSHMARSSFLKWQVLGEKGPTFSVNYIAVAVTIIAPPIALWLVWIIVVWIAQGFQRQKH